MFTVATFCDGSLVTFQDAKFVSIFISSSATCSAMVDGAIYEAVCICLCLCTVCLCSVGCYCICQTTLPDRVVHGLLQVTRQY